MTKALSIVVATSAMWSLLISACPGAKMPTGPSPEYEQPPAPSWLEAGSASAAPPTTAAPTIAPAPAPAAGPAVDASLD